MIGVDTSFLLAFEDTRHDLHPDACALAERHTTEGFAIAPQVLTEFLHVITDARRFTNPLTMDAALGCAERWWAAREVRHVFPNDRATALFSDWIREFSIGRKSLLDTMLAATYLSANVSLIATTNWRDFSRFPGIHVLVL